MGRDFGDRNEDEGALGEARMRNFESRVGENEIAIEQDVEVKGAGAIGDGGRAIAAEDALDGEENVEDRMRGEIGFKRDDGVEKARLIGEANWHGGIEGRTRGDAAGFCDLLERGGERGVWRPGGAGKVCAESDEGERHGFKSSGGLPHPSKAWTGHPAERNGQTLIW